MRTLHITTSQRAIAYVLLITQLLSSCSFNETILPSKKQEAIIQPITLEPSNTETDNSSTLPLINELFEPTSEQLSKRKPGDLGRTPLPTAQPGYPIKERPEQSSAQKKIPFSLNPTSFKPMKQKPKSPQEAGLIINKTSQLVPKSNQKATSNLVEESSHGTIGTILAPQMSEKRIAYGPYIISKNGSVANRK